MKRLALLSVVAIGCGGSTGAGTTASTTAENAAAESGALSVPATTTKIQCDGAARENAWHDAANTGGFVGADGKQTARPYSEMRFLANKTLLYFLFYAADEHIDGSDQFALDIVAPSAPDVTYHLQIAANGTVTASQGGGDQSWAAGIRTGSSVNGQNADDEEWMVEGALPLDALGIAPGDTVSMAIKRCDTGEDGSQSCGQWGRATDGSISGALVLPTP